jgi:hypothetical protein
MIANLIGGFVAILIGCTSVTQGGCENSALYLSSTWGATVLKLVPGFFALGIMGIGVAVTYSSLRQAGIV